MDRITILLIDDHRVVRQGVRAFLSTQPDLLVVGEAENGAEGVALAAQHVPDVALMDLVMPDLDGVEVASRIRQTHPTVKVVVVHVTVTLLTLAPAIVPLPLVTTQFWVGALGWVNTVTA